MSFLQITNDYFKLFSLLTSQILKVNNFLICANFGFQLPNIFKKFTHGRISFFNIIMLLMLFLLLVRPRISIHESLIISRKSVTTRCLASWWDGLGFFKQHIRSLPISIIVNCLSLELLFLLILLHSWVIIVGVGSFPKDLLVVWIILRLLSYWMWLSSSWCLSMVSW